MLLLLLAVLLGVVLGWKGNLPGSWSKNIHTLSRCFLLLMLFSLGAKLGTSAELHSHLITMGIQALVISILTIAGSILATYIVAPLIRPQSSQIGTEIETSTPGNTP